jgi:hypothetical protein
LAASDNDAQILTPKANQVVIDELISSVLQSISEDPSNLSRKIRTRYRNNNVPHCLETDELFIERILYHLIKNAYSYSNEDGEIVINISYEPSSEDTQSSNGFLFFSITNSVLSKMDIGTHIRNIETLQRQCSSTSSSSINRPSSPNVVMTASNLKSKLNVTDRARPGIGLMTIMILLNALGGKLSYVAEDALTTFSISVPVFPILHKGSRLSPQSDSKLSSIFSFAKASSGYIVIHLISIFH